MSLQDQLDAFKAVFETTKGGECLPTSEAGTLPIQSSRVIPRSEVDPIGGTTDRLN
jgi:hypothetical protein